MEKAVDDRLFCITQALDEKNSNGGPCLSIRENQTIH